MGKIICAWCNSDRLNKKSSHEFIKYEEYICQDCQKSTWRQTDYDINKLPPFLQEKREYLMLDPDFFSFSNNFNLG